MENLLILLDKEFDNNEGALLSFPTEGEMMGILNEKDTNITPVSTPSSQFINDQALAVIWDENDKRYWSIGFFLNKIDDATIRVDNLEQKGSDSENANWICPGIDDIQVALKDLQMLPYAVDGDWDLNKRQPTSILKNVQEIENLFKDYK